MSESVGLCVVLVRAKPRFRRFLAEIARNVGCSSGWVMQTPTKWTLVLVVAVVTAACGDSKSSLLPTSPSALSADSTSVDASTAAGHYGTTGGNGNGGG